MCFARHLEMAHPPSYVRSATRACDLEVAQSRNLYMLFCDRGMKTTAYPDGQPTQSSDNGRIESESSAQHSSTGTLSFAFVAQK